MREVILTLLLMGLALGCDSSVFVPPRPAELIRSTATPDRAIARSASSAPVAATSNPGARSVSKSSVARARLVELLLARPANLDRLYLEKYLRRDAGLNKCTFRSEMPEENEPSGPERLAREIRAAVDRTTGVLIVEPIDAPAVRDALHEAEAKGLSIVLLDAPLPSLSPGKSYPYVAFQPIAPVSRKLVETLADDAKWLHLPPHGKALVIKDNDEDCLDPDRLESIKKALQEAGYPFEIVEVVASVPNEAIELLRKKFETSPNVTIAVADHEYSLQAAFEGRDRWRGPGKHAVALGGYAACDARLDSLPKALSECVIDRNTEGYARKALQVALDLMDGKPVAERNEVELRLIHHIPTYDPQAAETKK
ncbi:MAG: substrate-binding domain-containing protein [Planctomycetaceae bacterium]|nr:substrate-binding domain-containing protein [Planctomycetaceae bacterium]